MARQCLNQQTPDLDAMTEAIAAWVEHRNAAIRTVDWHYTTDNARVRLRHFYPAFGA